MEARFMQMAIELARQGMENGIGGPFGAVVVQNGQAIGWGCNSVTSTLDPTAHAEIVAIRKACQTIGSFSLEGCELYSSCEPCPMCLTAAYWARLKVIYFAADRNDAREAGFDDEFFYQQINLPHHERKLPAYQFLAESARKLFADWKEKPDKIRY